MLMQKTMKINNQGHLEINGCDTVDLAASFGTPLMIIDEALLREKCQKYYQAFTNIIEIVAYQCLTKASNDIS